MRNSDMVEYNSYRAMKARCRDSNNERFESYGGRGITVCNRWLESFDNFLNDLGPRPVGSSLDRIDVNGNYEPENCKWSCSDEQRNNKRNSVKINLYGQNLTVAQWANTLEVPKNRIYGRILHMKKTGISLHEVIFSPKVSNGKRHD